MKTCSTCVHWTPVRLPGTGPLSMESGGGPLDVPLNPRGTYNERHELRNRGYGECGLARFGDDVAPEEVRPAMALVDGEGRQADLFTLAEFGCVLHAEHP